MVVKKPERIAVKTVKSRAYTTRAGYERLEEVLTLARRLYNGALEHRRQYARQFLTSCEYDGAAGRFKAFQYKRIPNDIDTNLLTEKAQNREFTQIRKDNPEYDGINVRLMKDSTTGRLNKAFQAFFRRVKTGQTPGYPRFKNRQAFNTLSSRHVEKSWYKRQANGKVHIKINGLPVLEIPNASRLPEGHPLSITITLKDRKLWVSLAYEFEPEKLPGTGAVVGLDRGVNKLVMDSNGVAAPRFRPDRKARRRAQRAMARKRHGKGIKPSRRYRAAKKAQSRLLEKERNRKNTAIHQLTASYVKDNDCIFVEGLNIRGMTRSAKGTAEAPGKGVKAKSGLNREILAQSWGQFLTQLKYKAEWAGRTVVEVDPAYTSQTCTNCGAPERRNRRGQLYYCAECGIRLDADFNAAVNILHRGLDALGRGESDPDGRQGGSQLRLW